MNSRARMIKTFEYDCPDRIPVVYHPSPAGLNVHGEKLLRLFQELPPDNPIEFNGIPHPDPSTVKDGVYHEFLTDEWGSEWEYLVYGIHGQVKKYPLVDYDALDAYEFPAIPSPDSSAAVLYRKQVAQQKQNYMVLDGYLSLFDKLTALRRMDDLLVDIYTREEPFMRLLDRLTDYMKKQAQYLVDAGVDAPMFFDDWGFQEIPMISVEHFREVFRPRYEEIFEIIRNGGRKVFFHSCGHLGPIFDELADMGIDGIWHQANRYDLEAFAQKCRNHKITAYLHPDRQHLVPFGAPKEIRERVKKYADIYHRNGGGGIFYIEMENDVPWENVEALIRAVHEFR